MVYKDKFINLHFSGESEWNFFNLLGEILSSNNKKFVVIGGSGINISNKINYPYKEGPSSGNRLESL